MCTLSPKNGIIFSNHSSHSLNCALALFGMVGATGDWSLGYAAANGVIVLALLGSLTFALVDLRRTGRVTA